jgi:hypothetical protein
MKCGATEDSISKWVLAGLAGIVIGGEEESYQGTVEALASNSEWLLLAERALTAA